MKVNGKDGIGVLRQLTQEELTKARSQKTNQGAEQSEDAASVDVANSELLSQSMTVEAMKEERRARVEELKRRYHEGTLKAADSNEVAEKLAEGIGDIVAINKVAQGE